MYRGSFQIASLSTDEPTTLEKLLTLRISQIGRARQVQFLLLNQTKAIITRFNLPSLFQFEKKSVDCNSREILNVPFMLNLYTHSEYDRITTLINLACKHGKLQTK